MEMSDHGCVQGIGKMISAGYVANGAHVFICSRKANVCEETARELNATYGEINHGKAVSLPGDLSTLEGVEKIIDALKKQTDKLNVLVNNAGATWGVYTSSSFYESVDLS